MPKCRYCNRPTPDPQDPNLRDRRVSHYDSDGYVVCLRKRCNTVRFLKESRSCVTMPRLPTMAEKAIMDELQREIPEYE